MLPHRRLAEPALKAPVGDGYAGLRREPVEHVKADVVAVCGVFLLWIAQSDDEPAGGVFRCTIHLSTCINGSSFLF